MFLILASQKAHPDMLMELSLTLIFSAGLSRLAVILHVSRNSNDLRVDSFGIKVPYLGSPKRFSGWNLIVWRIYLNRFLITCLKDSFLRAVKSLLKLEVFNSFKISRIVLKIFRINRMEWCSKPIFQNRYTLFSGMQFECTPEST